MEEARRRFSPGSVDYNGPIAANYRSGRSLSSQAAEAWRVALDPFITRVRHFTILDLGAGSGRFSALLASFFGAHVIGVEPSRAMLTAALEQRRDRVAYVAGTAERLPLRDH